MNSKGDEMWQPPNSFVTDLLQARDVMFLFCFDNIFQFSIASKAIIIP